MLFPSLSWRFQTNNRQWQYMRLRHDVFVDTFLAGTKSKRGKSYAEVFVTNFVWLHVFSMPEKGGAYEALYLFFQQDGVPPKMIVDGSKEQTLGGFKRKVEESGFHLRQTEPEPLW